jgi:hypothetical protein
MVAVAEVEVAEMTTEAMAAADVMAMRALMPK